MLGMYFKKALGFHRRTDSKVILVEITVNENGISSAVLVRPIQWFLNNLVRYKSQIATDLRGLVGIAIRDEQHFSFMCVRGCGESPQLGFESVAHSHAHLFLSPSSMPYSPSLTIPLSVSDAPCSSNGSVILISCSPPHSPASDGERDPPGDCRTHDWRICEVGIPLN